MLLLTYMFMVSAGLEFLQVKVSTFFCFPFFIVVVVVYFLFVFFFVYLLIFVGSCLFVVVVVVSRAPFTVKCFWQATATQFAFVR